MADAPRLRRIADALAADYVPGIDDDDIETLRQAANSLEQLRTEGTRLRNFLRFLRRTMPRGSYSPDVLKEWMSMI